MPYRFFKRKCGRTCDFQFLKFSIETEIFKLFCVRFLCKLECMTEKHSSYDVQNGLSIEYLVFKKMPKQKCMR